MDHWVDDRYHSLRDLRALIRTLVEPVDMFSLAEQAEVCAQDNLSQKNPCLNPLMEKVSDTDPIT